MANSDISNKSTSRAPPPLTPTTKYSRAGHFGKRVTCDSSAGEGPSTKATARSKGYITWADLNGNYVKGDANGPFLDSGWGEHNMDTKKRCEGGGRDECVGCTKARVEGSGWGDVRAAPADKNCCGLSDCDAKGEREILGWEWGLDSPSKLEDMSSGWGEQVPSTGVKKSGSGRGDQSESKNSNKPRNNIYEPWPQMGGRSILSPDPPSFISTNSPTWEDQNDFPRWGNGASKSSAGAGTYRLYSDLNGNERYIYHPQPSSLSRPPNRYSFTPNSPIYQPRFLSDLNGQYRAIYPPQFLTDLRGNYIPFSTHPPGLSTKDMHDDGIRPPWYPPYQFPICGHRSRAQAQKDNCNIYTNAFLSYRRQILQEQADDMKTLTFSDYLKKHLPFLVRAESEKLPYASEDNDEWFMTGEQYMRKYFGVGKSTNEKDENTDIDPSERASSPANTSNLADDNDDDDKHTITPSDAETVDPNEEASATSSPKNTPFTDKAAEPLLRDKWEDFTSLYSFFKPFMDELMHEETDSDSDSVDEGPSSYQSALPLRTRSLNPSPSVVSNSASDGQNPDCLESCRESDEERGRSAVKKNVGGAKMSSRDQARADSIDKVWDDYYVSLRDAEIEADFERRVESIIKKNAGGSERSGKVSSPSMASTSTRDQGTARIIDASWDDVASLNDEEIETKMRKRAKVLLRRKIEVVREAARRRGRERGRGKQGIVRLMMTSFTPTRP